MEINISNGEWGYQFYFSDPAFPENLKVWLRFAEKSDLSVGTFAAWLSTQDVVGNAYLVFDDSFMYSSANRIVDQFNRHMSELGIFYDGHVFGS